MIVMGDMNAIVRDDGSIWGIVRGSHEEQVSLKMGGGCSAVTTISNTLFPHKKIHKYTWELRCY